MLGEVCVCECDPCTSSSDSLCCPTGSICVVSKDNCKERVGEADAKRRGFSHIFSSGLLARLMAVCVCVGLQSTQVGLRTMSLYDSVHVCVSLSMHACA